MPITSPFDGLRVDQALVCEFFATFARFEFVLKELNIVRDGQELAEPAWRTFALRAAEYLAIPSGSGLADAVKYLVDEPPQVQLAREGWQARALHGTTDIEKAIDATCRVRNNLFHGGKHTSHSPPNRDQRLVESALALLIACVEQNRELKGIFEQHAVSARLSAG